MHYFTQSPGIQGKILVDGYINILWCWVWVESAVYSTGNSNADILLMPLRFGKSFASERTLTHGWHGRIFRLRIFRSASVYMKAHWLPTMATTATPNATTIQAELEASLWFNCTWRIALAFSLAHQKVPIRSGKSVHFVEDFIPARAQGNSPNHGVPLLLASS